MRDKIYFQQQNENTTCKCGNIILWKIRSVYVIYSITKFEIEIYITLGEIQFQLINVSHELCTLFIIQLTRYLIRPQ